jgi:phosphoenolpyruvate synthase/pyruvate phosphate dikinase
VKKEMPRDPASIRYYAELEHLRKIALVRLRHSTRPVDVEWCVVKHEPPFTASKDDATHKQLKNRFEQWWMEKKQQVAKLDEQGKELCTGVYFSLGWSDTPGMDHTEIVM